MAATKKGEVEQMKMVLQEMNNHPEARLFYSLQEREVLDSDSARLTLRLITDKVHRSLYPNLTAFVEDMTTLFSTCPSNSLATGVAPLKELFTEVLSKFTQVLEKDYDSTPPGKKKRLRNTSGPIPYADEEDTLTLTHSSDDDFAEIIVDDCFSEEFMHSTDRAALLELTEEIASIEAEIQQLKETKQDLHSSDQPGWASHTSILDALKTPSFLSFSPIFASSAEEGRVALSAQQNKKRPRRNSNAQVSIVEVDDDWTLSRPVKRRAGNAKSKTSKQLQEFQAEIMTKEQLLNTITHDLPPKFLEGVIRIVNPTYDPASATDEDLEFDINLLDDDVLGRLQQYVNTILATPQRKKTRPQTTKVTHKKESPKRRLQKEAPKKVNRKRTTGSRKRTSLTSKQKKQQALLAATLAGTRPTFVSAEHLKQVFMKEEIVRVTKSAADVDEDEEVDILD